MHMDSDATLTCKPDGPDPFEEMHRSDAVYGLFEAGVEDPEYVEGWSSFVEEYVLLHEVKPSIPRLLLSTKGERYSKEEGDNPTERYDADTDNLGVTWGTAWEILDLGFFASQRVLEFSRKVERSLGHYRHNWGDHVVRAFQVQLFAKIDKVRCFDAQEIPGHHGCADYSLSFGSSYVYQWLNGIVCPDKWSGQVIRNVPFELVGGNPSPRACIEYCNEAQCLGFDVLFSLTTGMADCNIRRTMASEDTCIGGGAGGAAGEAWANFFGEPIVPGVILGTANRYEILEKTVNRTMNCRYWKGTLALKLAEATNETVDWTV